MTSGSYSRYISTPRYRYIYIYNDISTHFDRSLHRDDSLPDLVLSAALPPPTLASNTTSTSTADLEAEYFGGAASDQVLWLL